MHILLSVCQLLWLLTQAVKYRLQSHSSSPQNVFRNAGLFFRRSKYATKAGYRSRRRPCWMVYAHHRVKPRTQSAAVKLENDNTESYRLSPTVSIICLQASGYRTNSGSYFKLPIWISPKNRSTPGWKYCVETESFWKTISVYVCSMWICDTTK